MAGLTSTVWMIHSGISMEGIKGDLTLELGAVVFTPREGHGQRMFRLSDIRRAKRVLGSPVLELRLAPTGGPTVVGFYFVQPPSLEAQRDSRIMQRRRMRREAAISLARLNPVKKSEVSAWVDAIDAAKRGR